MLEKCSNCDQPSDVFYNGKQMCLACVSNQMRLTMPEPPKEVKSEILCELGKEDDTSCLMCGS